MSRTEHEIIEDNANEKHGNKRPAQHLEISTLIGNDAHLERLDVYAQPIAHDRDKLRVDLVLVFLIILQTKQDGEINQGPAFKGL